MDLEEFARVADGFGYDVVLEDDGTATWLVAMPFFAGTLTLVAVAAVDGDDVVIDCGCPVVDCDPERLDKVVPPPPVLGFWLDFDEGSCNEGSYNEGEEGEGEEGEGDGGEDEEVWVVAHGAFPTREVAAGLRHFFDVVFSCLDELARAGVIQLVHAGDADPSILEDIVGLEDFKAREPKEAMALARDLAERCRAVGDFTRGAICDLAAAEIAANLGEIRLAWQLAEPAWVVLCEPIEHASLVSSYAMIVQAHGQNAEAVELLCQAELAAADPADVALLRGNRGVLLAGCGHFPEAIALIQASLAEPALREKEGRELTVQLAACQRMIGADQTVSLMSASDFLDEVNLDLGIISSLLARTGLRADLVGRLAEVEAVLDRVKTQWDLLGPAQQVRVHLIGGFLAFVRGDRRAARVQMHAAAEMAKEAGDIPLSRWATLGEAAFGNRADLSEPPVDDPTVMERIQFYGSACYNQVFAIAGAKNEAEGLLFVERALDFVLKAVRAIDEDRKRFVAVGDRVSWARLGGRIYEWALAFAVIMERKSLVIELLERVRAQGLPTVAGSSPYDNDFGFGLDTIMGTAQTGPSPLPPLETALDALVVGAPRIATTSGRSEILLADDAVKLEDLVDSIAGPDAWWWSCHLFDQRLYWSLRGPDGEISVGRNEAGGAGSPDMQRLASFFEPPTLSDDLTDHLLVGDRRRRLDKTLRYLAELLLPERLAAVIRAAAADGHPIRVVWAAPSALCTLPVGLLPVGGGHRLLHGAIVTLAPPTSLVSRPTSECAPTRDWSEIVVLGADDKLQQAGFVVGGLGLAVPPSRVLGSTSHVSGRRPLAGSLATPESVRTVLSTQPSSLMLYYGHVIDGGASPLTTSLLLTDGGNGPHLRVGSLLAGPPRGAPDVTVLCGCSSLDPSSMGSGEWWGFGIGLLWQGSQQVVGSVWKLIDCAATARFATELVVRLRSGHDPALVLHDLQLEWLADWERDGSNRFTQQEEDRHPILWSGWAVTGFVGRPGRHL